MSGAELALGIVPLVLTSIKASIGASKRIAVIFQKDNGLRFLATQYHVEKVKLEIWAELVNISDTNTNDCLLLNHSEVVQNAVLSTMAEISATYDSAEKLVQRYGIAKPALATTPAGDSTKTFTESSTWVKSAKDERNAIKQTHKINWAFKDQEELQTLVKRLGKLNDNLRDLVRVAEIDVVRIVTGVLSGLQSKSLDPLHPDQGSQEQPDLLSLSARIKQMQAEDVIALSQKVKILKGTFDRVSSIGDDGISVRETGYYNESDTAPSNVWVEWKPIASDDPRKDDLITRVKALNALLTASSLPQYLQPKCLGLLNDRAYEERTRGHKRLGFIYRFPNNDSSQDLITLQDMLSQAKKCQYRPPLGERFELARKLASALSLLHATDWIHKSLRSDNIVFISTSGGGASPPQILTNPKLAGFQYSRQAGPDSIEKRASGNAKLEMYYHPDVVAKGWTKAREVYSLGIVLLEVGYWRTAFDAKFDKNNMNATEVSNSIIRSLEGSWGNQLEGLVGKVYINVVRECLTGFSDVSDDMSPQLLSKLFFHRVVKPLSTCKA